MGAADQGELAPTVSWSSKPHHRRLLVIHGTAALVFFALATPGILLGMSFTLACLLVVFGVVGLFITIAVLERRLLPPSDYVAT